MRINLVWIAFGVSVLSTIPQLVQIIQTKEARDFNLVSVYMALIANTLIGIEALRRGHNATIVLSLWLIIYWVIILYYKVYLGHRKADFNY
jgi:uncharacterized protein with PQ loop repeat